MEREYKKHEFKTNEASSYHAGYRDGVINTICSVMVGVLVAMTVASCLIVYLGVA